MESLAFKQKSETPVSLSPDFFLDHLDWKLLNAANSVNWLLSLWKRRFLEKHFLICKSFSPGPRSSETTWLHAAEQSMELWQALFHNASCWEMADPLFSRPTSLWARVPAVSTLKKHTSLLGYIFLSFLQTLEATVTITLPTAAGPALSASPLSKPSTAEPGWRRSCRCTARKHAAATIIALIARFFCWAEISGGATILLLKPPKTSK